MQTVILNTQQSMKNEMEVFFTSPILGQIYGRITTENDGLYRFIGKSVLVNIELRRTESGWLCEKEEWLHDTQVTEIGSQIDEAEKLSCSK